MPPDRHFTMFYDGLCPLCSREVQFLRKRNTEKLLTLIDTAAQDFKAEACCGARAALRTGVGEVHFMREQSTEFVRAHSAKWMEVSVRVKRSVRDAAVQVWIEILGFTGGLQHKHCSWHARHNFRVELLDAFPGGTKEDLVERPVVARKYPQPLGDR
jgi:DCC1-like thiol-disulfide oxidoreductase